MSKQYVPISDGDKAVITATAKLISGKSYHPADAALLLIEVMADPSGIKFSADGLGNKNESNLGSVSRHFPPI